MNKRTELFKSIALTLLVIMSMVLFANSWVREWSYSGNENDNLIRKLASAVGLDWLFSQEIETPGSTDIVSPSRIILTSGAKRIITDKGTDMYTDCYGDILSILLSMEKVDATPALISENEWYAAQKTQAVYLDYGVTYRRSIMEACLGFSLPSEIENISAMVLTSNDSATNKLVVCFQDASKDKYYKLLTDKSAKGIKKVLSDSEGYENIPLACELGFNTSPEEGIDQHVVIKGNTVIDLNVTSLPGINYHLFENASELDNQSLNSLLSLFGMSKNSSELYADSDGSIMYIDEFGTLRFSGNTIEYTSANPNRGKSLIKSNTSTDMLYNITFEGYNQAYSVSELYGIKNLSLRISSDMLTSSYNDDGSISLNIDYCAGGIPILTHSEEDKNIAENAISLTFNSSGELIYYKHTLFTAELTNEHSQILPILDAINNVYSYSVDPKSVLYVQDIFSGYKLTGKEINPVWYVRFKGDSRTYSI